MPTTSGLNNEQNFITQWMSNVSRAGVILNPSFSALESNRESPLSRNEIISVNSQSNCMLFSSNGSSISEDSLHEEEMLEASSFHEETDTLEMINQLRASHWTKKGPMICKDAPNEWEDVRIGFSSGDVEGPDEEIDNEPLLQKLEQLKERQQEKQEQLKKKQMEQIQKLMEEQKKLLVLVSGQKSLPGENSIFDEPNPDQSLGDCSNSDLNAENDDLSPSTDGTKCSETALTEERPILSCIKETKQSFEEFLEEQMKLEERRLKERDQIQSLEPVNKPVVKRPFLKCGDGLARFTNSKSKLSKSKRVIQQRTEDRQTSKTERQQLQRKTALPSKEQLSENVFAIFNQTAKPKNNPAVSTQKVMVLRNLNGKNLSPPTTKELSEHKLDGHLRSSLQSEINCKLETNKDNVIVYAKQAFDIDSKLKKSLEGVDKLSTSTVLTSTWSTHAPSKNPENSFELSFQKRSETWEKEKEKENLELDEFLLLEQVAEDTSFSSNSSFVLKLLTQDQQISKSRRISSTPVKLGQQQQAVATNSKTKQAAHVTQGSKTDSDMSTNPDFRVSGTRLNEQYNNGGKLFQTSRTVDNLTLKSTKLGTNSDERNGHMMADFEDDLDNTITSEKERTEKLVFSNREDNPKYDGCQVPSKNISKECTSRDQDLDLSDQEDYNNEELSMTENKSVQNDAMLHPSKPFLNGNDAEFDDDRTWADIEENEQLPMTEIYISKDKTQSTTSIPDKVIKRKVASIKKGEEQSKEKMDSITNSRPISNLMMKLFPSLKSKQKSDLHIGQDTRFGAGQEETIEDTARSQLLKKKLVELETEIERFKAENASLAKLHDEREHALETLRKEITDFEQQKSKELARIEEFKKEEMKKLQKERKVFEKYASAARAIPDKKERDEIQVLKQQLTDLQEELKRKEARWSTTQIRLRNQIEAVMKENAELRQEIKILEKVRLETWKKAEAPENNEAEINRVVLKRVDSSSPPNRIKKSQTPSPGSEAEKTTKTNCRSHSPAKGKHAERLKPVPIGEPNSSDKMKIRLTESPGISMSGISCNELSIPPKPYISGFKENDEIQEEIKYADGKVIKVLKNGCHVIHFPNGTRKDVSADAKTITVTFFNGDVKQVMPDQRVIYYYADARTTHTTYPDGLEVLHFSNGQIEKHYPDGKKEITFPDQTVKNLFLDGSEESIFPDGTIVRVQLNGNKIIEFDNGQRELHTAQFKRREYPDGTVKTVYNDGHQETKYASGRLRIKDKDGNVLVDTKL